MSVSPTTSSSGGVLADWQSTYNQVRTDFRSLSQAVQSGNLADAQQAFATLQNDLPTATSASSQASGSAQSTALGQLGKALQSGDLSGAQQALAALQQARHGHHHRHGHAAAATPPASDALSPTTGDTSIAGQSGSILNASA